MGGLFRGGIFAVKIISANMPPHFYRNYAPPQVCLARLDFLRQNVFMPPPIPHHIQGSHGRHQISIGTPPLSIAVIYSMKWGSSAAKMGTKWGQNVDLKSVYLTN